MTVKETVRQQYVRLVDQAGDRLRKHETPSEGWITTFRKAISLSASQLAKRAGVTRAAIYQAIGNEKEGRITLRQMDKIATALGGRFVYAIVTDEHVDEVIRARATKKAQAVIQQSMAHMALEDQSLSAEQNQQQVKALADELARTLPSDFWEDA